MSRAIQIRRGTADEHKDFIGLEAEVTYDTTNKTLRVHDGVTPGGIPLARTDDTGAIPDNMSDIVYAMMPDYSQATSFPATGTYTAETNLYLQGRVKLVWNAAVNIKILDETGKELIVYSFLADDTNSTRYMSFSIPVPRGYKYSVTHGGNGIILGSVIPCIGG